MFEKNPFKNHPVLGLVVGSVVLIGSTIIAGVAGSWIGEGTVKLMLKD